MSTVAVNHAFYEHLWRGASFCGPECLNTWPLLSALASQAADRLELGPGLRPRLPVKGTRFVDLSEAAVRALAERGGLAEVGDASVLDFPERSMDLVAAFDIVEHIDDDRQLFTALARMIRPGGHLVFSVPVHEEAWSTFDEWVGHARRYEPGVLEQLLNHFGFEVEASTAFGMKPRGSRLSCLGLWWVKTFPKQAFYWYNRWFFPLALRRQEPLVLTPGMADASSAEGLLLKCKRRPDHE